MVGDFTLFFWDVIVAQFLSAERCIDFGIITDLEADPSDNVSLILDEINELTLTYSTISPANSVARLTYDNSWSGIGVWG